jgi:hypothetical protein
MRTALKVIPLGALVFLTGCIVPSLHPFYTDKDLVFERALVGSWLEYQVEGDPSPPAIPQVWTFSKAESTNAEGAADGYDVKVRVKDYMASYQARLMKANDTLFLDLLPDELQTPEFRPKADDGRQQSAEEGAGGEVTGLFMLHYVPTHSVWRMRLDHDELMLTPLGDDWATAQAGEKTLGLRYETVSDTTVLTASSEELRGFLLRHAHDDKAFPTPWVYRRQQPEASGQTK